MNPQTRALRSALYRGAAFVALVVTAAVFYVVAITLWALVGDPSGVHLLAALFATCVSGYFLSRYFGIL